MFSLSQFELPTEVLGVIIHHALPTPLLSVKHWTKNHNGQIYAQNLTRISRVCSFWRQVALADPRFWAILPCELDRSSFAIWVARAQDCPLHVYVAASPMSTCDGYFGLHMTRKLMDNLRHALQAHPPVHSLSITLGSENIKSAFLETLVNYSSALQYLETYDVCQWGEGSPDIGIPFATSPPTALRKLDLRECSLKWSSLTQTTLTRLSLCLNNRVSNQVISSGAWRAILTHSSKTLRCFELDDSRSYSSDFHPLITVSLGERIHMKAMNDIRLRFRGCVEYASQLSYNSSVNIVLKDITYGVPTPVLTLHNMHLVHLIAKGSLSAPAFLVIEYSMDQTTLVLGFGTSSIKYTFAQKRGCNPAKLIKELSTVLRSSVLQLDLIGSPWDCEDMDLSSLSDLLPQVYSISIDKLTMVPGRGILPWFIKSQIGLSSPAFPNLSVLRFRHYVELGDEYLLVQVAEQRNKHAACRPLQMLCLNDPGAISTACMRALEDMEPKCLVVSEAQFAASSAVTGVVEEVRRSLASERLKRLGYE